MSKRSEYSESKKSDAEFERRSKHKHDAPMLEPEHESESESDSQHVSNTVDRQDRTKEHESQEDSQHISDTVDRQDHNKEHESQEEKGDEVSRTSKVQHLPEVTRSKRSKRQSLIIFTYKDQKKILKRLYESGHTKCTVEFWELVRDSLKLSTSFNQRQLYQKIRRLQHKFIKIYNNKSRKVMSDQDRKLYRLSRMIWKEEAKAHKKAKQEHAVEDNNYGVKLGKLDVEFNVAEWLDFIPGSKSSVLEKKWNGLNVSMLKLFKEKIDLIQETMGAIVSPPSFPSFYDN